MSGSNYKVSQHMLDVQNKFDDIYFQEMEDHHFEFKETIKCFNNVLENEPKDTARVILRALRLDTGIYQKDRKYLEHHEALKLYKKLVNLRKAHLAKNSRKALK